MKQSRRGRIIDLLKQGLTDDTIIDALDIECPPGTFKTTNETALYGTKYDLDKTREKEPRQATPKPNIRQSAQLPKSRIALIQSLQSFNVQIIIDRYRRNDLEGKTPGQILDFSVDNSIYRAFRYETPSVRYKKWRWHKTPEELVLKFKECRNQEQFDELVVSLGLSLVADWGKTNERGEPSRMNIGVAMKITNLVMKHLFFSGYVQNKSAQKWLHVPWDSFTLKPLRTIWKKAPSIPTNPGQGFVNNLVMYKQLHKLISEIAEEADVPRINYEFYAWNHAHEVPAEKRGQRMSKYGRGLNREIVAAVNAGIISEQFSTTDVRRLIKLKKWVSEPTEKYIMVTLANASSDDHSPTYKKYFYSKGDGLYSLRPQYKGNDWL